MTQPPLALILLVASRWFDSNLREELVRRGWPPLSAAQSLVFAHLRHEGIAPATLARELGHSRQATAQLTAGLTQLHLVEIVNDPQRQRGKLVILTVRGRTLAVEAQEILGKLERHVDPTMAELMRIQLPRLSQLSSPSEGV